MLVIKIELWPFGNEAASRSLGEMRLWNDGTGTAESGNYVAQLDGKEVKIKNHLRSAGAWVLLGKALNKLFLRKTV